MQTPWDHRYAQRTQRMKSSAIRELLKVSERKEVISFECQLPSCFLQMKSWKHVLRF